MVFGGESVKASEQLVQQTHQLLGSALVRETGEATDVRKQNANIVVLLDVDLVELRLLRLTRNVVLHLHRHVPGQNGQQKSLLLLVLALRANPRIDALPCLEERLSLRLLPRPMRVEAGKVDAQQRDTDAGQSPLFDHLWTAHGYDEVGETEHSTASNGLSQTNRQHCVGQVDEY